MTQAKMTQYPLSEQEPESLKTPSGLPFSAINLDGVMSGRIHMEDLRVTPEALEAQATIAESAGRRQLADNLRRASELARVPEDKMLQVYQALRPGRATPDMLESLAVELESKWHAIRCARFIREAAQAYFPSSSQSC